MATFNNDSDSFELGGLCHAHQDILDDLDLHALETDFISRSDIRKNLFGYHMDFSLRIA